MRVRKMFVTSCQINCTHGLNTILKLGLGAGILGTLFWGASAIKKAAAKFSFEIVGFGTPKLSNFLLTVPLTVRFKNQTSVPVYADRVLAEFYINKSGQYVYAGYIDQPVNIPAQVSDQQLNPTLDLKSVFGGNLTNTIMFINQAIATRQIQVRTDVTISYGNVSLPKQSFNETLPLS